MEERCFACGRSDDEVRLFDAIYGREMVKTCRECSSRRDVILIKKPSSLQLKDSEKPPTVYERLSKMVGLPIKQEKQEQKEKEIKEEEKEEKPFQLIDNFQWYIQKARRKKGLSQRQLADELAESETIIKMIENTEIPENGERVIKKIEQFLGIKIRKSKEEEKMVNGGGPARILKFDKDSIGNLTISDLRKMKEKREQAEKIERIRKEEERKENEWKGLTKKEREGLIKQKENNEYQENKGENIGQTTEQN